MTVCIAVIAEGDTNEQSRIVVCTDALTSGDLGSADYYHKDIFLTHSWHCLTAGSAGEINALIPLLRNRFRNELVVDETNICRLVREAIAARKTEKADEYTIARWGMSFGQFLKLKDQFPEAEFEKATAEVAQIPLTSDLLIVGFLSDDLPIIVSAVGANVELVEHFGVAGHGANLAQASLLQREHKSGTALPVAIYHAYEAKRHAERVRTVGTFTHVAVLEAKKPPALISIEAMKYLRKQFDKYGPKEITDTSIAMPPGYLETMISASV